MLSFRGAKQRYQQFYLSLFLSITKNVLYFVEHKLVRKSKCCSRINRGGQSRDKYCIVYFVLVFGQNE